MNRVELRRSGCLSVAMKPENDAKPGPALSNHSGEMELAGLHCLRRMETGNMPTRQILYIRTNYHGFLHPSVGFAFFLLTHFADPDGFESRLSNANTLQGPTRSIS